MTDQPTEHPRQIGGGRAILGDMAPKPVAHADAGRPISMGAMAIAEEALTDQKEQS